MKFIRVVLFLLFLATGISAAHSQTGMTDATTAPPHEWNFGAKKAGAAGTYKVFVSPKRSHVGSDICKRCLSGEPLPICTLIYCHNLKPDEVVFPIYVPPSASKAFDFCKGTQAMKALCGSNISKEWSYDTPKGDPSPWTMKPYKNWLEISRITSDEMLKSGAVSKNEYKAFLDAYRSDFKAMGVK